MYIFLKRRRVRKTSETGREGGSKGERKRGRQREEECVCERGGGGMRERVLET